jgi:uncharacterized protein
LIHTFKHDGTGFVLDVETGSVHVLDDDAFEAVTRLEKIENDGGDIDAALSEGGPLLEEIAELKNAGLLFSEAEDGQPLRENVVKAMCLHLAHDCNLRCDYCFAKGGAFAGRRELMSAETAKAAIDFLVGVSGTRRN